MRSEYLYATLLQGFLLTPLLMTIHEMLVVRKLVNAYEVAYVLSIVQTLTMLLYHWY